MDKPGKRSAKIEIGYAGNNTRHGDIRADEFVRDLQGKRGLKKYQEMRDNDATVGAIMYGTEQILRDVPRIIEPANDTEEAKEMADWLETVFDDMEHTMDDHISQALSNLTYGFADFEVVYKIRGGPGFVDKKRYSKFADGHYGVRKIASRNQHTISKFEVDPQTGDFLGIHQDYGFGKRVFIPSSKLLHYKTVTTNNDPSGRSVLRNAYKSYTYLCQLQTTEGIAIERELNGIPVISLPSEYLSADATPDQRAIVEMARTIGRDIKFNEQGAIVLPSDPYIVDDKVSTVKQVELKLVASEGTRNVEIDPVIRRYQHDIARSVLAEFLMLGSSSTGSYALSKSKTDMFLRSMESYINSIYDVVNLQLVRPLWEMNGFDVNLMPKVIAGDVAPHDLKELGSYIRNLNGANIDLTNQVDIVDELLGNAELSKLDRVKYQESLDKKDKIAEAKMKPKEVEVKKDD